MRLKNGLINKLARFTRARRFYRMDPILRKIYSPDHRRFDSIDTVVKLPDGFLMRIDTASYLEWCVFFYGSYEPMISTIIKTLLKDGDVALDVGANVGIHSLYMADAIGKDGRVYCFEPHPTIYERLVENISLNRMSWVSPIKAGLSDVVGEQTLYGFSGDDGNQGVSSMINKGDGPSFTITTLTLDKFVDDNSLVALDLIKVDVEGAEFNVLSGGINTLEKFNPVVIFEYNDDLRVLDLFEKLSYHFYVIGHDNLLPIKKTDITSSVNNLLAIPSVRGRQVKLLVE